MSSQTVVVAVVVLLIIVAVAAVVVGVVLHDDKAKAPVPGCCCQTGTPTTTTNTSADADCDVPSMWTTGACSATAPPTCATAWFDSRNNSWGGAFTVTGGTAIYNLSGNKENTPIWTSKSATKWLPLHNVGYPRPGNTVATTFGATTGTKIPVAFSTIAIDSTGVITFA